MVENDPPLPMYEAPSTRQRFDAATRRLQRRFWDEQAADWDAGRAARGLQPHHLGRMQQWLAGPVLLVGAGRGTMLLALRARGHVATGVDWSEAMVAAARRDGTAGLGQGDAGDLPCRSEALGSVIFSTGILLPTHAPERRHAYVEEAARVLVAGGHLILCLWYEQGSAAARRAAESVRLPIHTLQAQVHWDLAPLASTLSACGLVTVDQTIHDDVLVWTLAKPGSEFYENG